MSLSTVNVATLELVSTLRSAPLRGSASSRDYNDADRERVIDLSTLADFINNILLPMLNLLPPNVVAGIDGGAIYADTSSQETVFYNAATSQSLTVADAIRFVYAAIQAIQSTLTDVNLQISDVQTRLSASNQDDIALALQNLNATLAQQAALLKALGLEVSSLQQLQVATQDGRVATPQISPNAIETVTVNWTVPFPNNNYTVSYGMEDQSGYLQINGFFYLDNGVGIGIRVLNNDANNANAGTVHALARASQLSS